MSVKKPAAKTVKAVLDALEVRHGIPDPEHGKRRSPLDSLIGTVLSQNTSDVNSARAFASLKQAFPDWETVRKAPPEKVEEAIKSGGLSRQKTKTIQSILNRLKQEQGALTLDHLADMSIPKATDYLLSFKGVGKKTAACVLLFSMNKDAFPVDTHIHRITGRLGWIPDGASADQAHEILGKLIPKKRYLTAHVNLIAHGKAICSPSKPKCGDCSILSWCEFGPAK